MVTSSVSDLGYVHIQQENQGTYAGIFVANGTGLSTLLTGEKVTITGTVKEYFGLTRWESVTSVTKNGASWFIDKKGNALNTFQYSHIDQFDTSGYARFTKDGLMGFMNKKGVEVIEGKYKEIDFFYEGLAYYKIKDKIYFINLNGEIVIERKCSKGTKFQDGLSRVKMKNLYGFIDKNNTLLIDYKYENATNFHEGYALVQKES